MYKKFVSAHTFRLLFRPSLKDRKTISQFFLLLDDGRGLLTHHLLAGFKGDCFSVSEFDASCRLIEEQNTSKTANFFNLLLKGKSVLSL